MKKDKNGKEYMSDRYIYCMLIFIVQNEIRIFIHFCSFFILYFSYCSLVNFRKKKY